MMAPGAGMEEVIRALEKNLREKLGDRFKLGTEIRELPTGKNIVLAVPADSAAKLLAQQDPELSNALKLIRYVPLVSVTVFVRKEYLLNIPKGVGVLFPEEENMNCLGILFNSSAFPSRVNDVNQVISLTALLGGSENSQALKLSDSEVIQKIECDVNQVFGLRGKISSYQIHRWEKAIPIYDQTLIDTWSVAKRGWGSISGHVLFGNYTGQVSIRGMIETLFHQESDKIIRVE
jgi:oxygen-dependent protoporphyrinogen oxidase